MVGESQEAVGVGAGAGPSSNKMPTLEEYGTNLTSQASEVSVQPLSGNINNVPESKFEIERQFLPDMTESNASFSVQLVILLQWCSLDDRLPLAYALVMLKP